MSHKSIILTSIVVWLVSVFIGVQHVQSAKDAWGIFWVTLAVWGSTQLFLEAVFL